MPKLRLDQAPTASLPLRFLLTMPCWGMAGGLLLLVDADAALRVRWHPATLALVHVWTLGVLGNAMFGSLLQFLPAAAGVRLRGERSAPWLHAVFNLGVVLLVAGLRSGARGPLLVAGMLLPASFLWLGAMIVPGLVGAVEERLLRAGIGAALVFGLFAALLGGTLALLLGARVAWPLTLVDVHASLGVFGWMIVLLAAVGRVTLPMFQATGMVSARTQASWLGTMVAGLIVASAAHLLLPQDWALPATVAIGGTSFALAASWLQWRVPRARRNALFLHWRVGLLALTAGGIALLAGRGMLAGVLGVGIGIPLLVGAMALEIVPFVGWIALRQRLPRGIRLPAVQHLLPDPRKRRVLLAQCVAAPLLAVAVLWPQPVLVRLAALAQLGAWSIHGHALASALRSCRAFLLRHVASDEAQGSGAGYTPGAVWTTRASSQTSRHPNPRSPDAA